MKNTIFVATENYLGKQRNVLIVADTPQIAMLKAKHYHKMHKPKVQKLPIGRAD